MPGTDARGTGHCRGLQIARTPTVFEQRPTAPPQLPWAQPTRQLATTLQSESGSTPHPADSSKPRTLLAGKNGLSGTKLPDLRPPSSESARPNMTHLAQSSVFEWQPHGNMRLPNDWR